MRSNIRFCLVAVGMFGVLLISISGNGVQPGQMPPGVNAPYGWYTDTDGYLEPITGVNVPPVIYPKATKNPSGPLGLVLLLIGATGAALITVLWRPRSGGGTDSPPDFPPGEQIPPDPSTDPPPLQARSGGKPIPVNRELPMDRPHPWRTWEG